MGRRSYGWLVSVGAMIFLVGLGSTIWVLHGSPLWLILIAWMAAGFGMGTAFPVIPLAVMASADEGAEARELSRDVAHGHPRHRGRGGGRRGRDRAHRGGGHVARDGLTSRSRSQASPASRWRRLLPGSTALSASRPSHCGVERPGHEREDDRGAGPQNARRDQHRVGAERLGQRTDHEERDMGAR